jgi:nucleoside-diphosphate-sugar epimerase
MRIFVAGAAGAIGRQLLPQLAAQGHQVTAATRSPAKASLLRELGAGPVVFDGLDAAAVGEAVARAEPEVVVHQMTSLAGGSGLRRFDRLLDPAGRLVNVFVLDIADGRIQTIRSVINPHKLRHLGPLANLDDLRRQLR